MFYKRKQDGIQRFCELDNQTEWSDTENLGIRRLQIDEPQFKNCWEGGDKHEIRTSIFHWRRFWSIHISCIIQNFNLNAKMITVEKFMI